MLPPSAVPVFAPARSAGAGLQASARLQAFNGRLGPELRRTLADVVLQITGTAGLANTGTDSGDAALYAAHEAAITLHQMGYQGAGDLLRAEEGWYADDFRGRQGERPTLKQFVEWAARAQAAPRDAKRNGGKAYAGQGKPASAILARDIAADLIARDRATHDNRAALRRLLGLGPDDPLPDDDASLGD